jgi:hypothetical protein
MTQKKVKKLSFSNIVIFVIIIIGLLLFVIAANQNKVLPQNKAFNDDLDPVRRLVNQKVTPKISLKDDWNPVRISGKIFLDTTIMGWNVKNGPLGNNWGSGLRASEISKDGRMVLLLGDKSYKNALIPLGYVQAMKKYLVTADKHNLIIKNSLETYDTKYSLKSQHFFDTLEFSINIPGKNISDDMRRKVDSCLSNNFVPEVKETIKVNSDSLVYCAGGTVTDLTRNSIPFQVQNSEINLDLSSYVGKEISFYMTLWSREYDNVYANDRGYYNTYAYLYSAELQ